MHLLLAQQGEVGDGTEPVDPGQSPADIVVISANDSELAALAEAQARLGPGAPSLRLARLDWLRHPYSVDLYLDATLSKARLVVARILGGEGYWAYGIEQCCARLGPAGVRFVALPGDDRPDPDLARLSAAGAGDWEALRTCLVEGGPGNAETFLRHCAHLIGAGPRPPAAAPLLRAGVYLPAAWLGGGRVGDLDGLRARWVPGRPVAAVVFYRALLQGGGLAPVDALADALAAEGLNPLPVFVASLKEAVSAATLAALFAEAPPAVVLNATSFAVGAVEAGPEGRTPTPLDAPGAPVLQVVFSGADRAAWAAADRGLGARDIAMNVALPEVDGRILARAVAFKGELRRDVATECPILGYRPEPGRIAFAARLAAGWVRLAATPRAERRLALVLANYPNRDGRLGNGVGLDTPASAAGVLQALAAAGYGIAGAPADGAALMAQVTAGPTNAAGPRTGGEALALADYRAAFAWLPEPVRQAVTGRWGPPEADPFVAEGAFRLALHRFGNAVLGVQPARGYNIAPAETYHSPDLVPPHGYFAFYIWLREQFGAQAVVHLGKHGNLEWLPGKAVSLSEACFPEAVLGPMPHLYPFIVNDPGEGTQAKRRAQAVILDHLTPPLTRAETYGPLRDLEALVDEYYEAAGVDARRLAHLRREILALTERAGIDRDAGIAAEDDADSRLRKLDEFLCELKESQIRDGLHVFGEAPAGRLETDLLAALARLPRGRDRGASASLIRALARDLGLWGEEFDPLDCAMSAPWEGPRPAVLAGLTGDAWRSAGDTVERLELLAARLLAGQAPPPGAHSAAVIGEVEARLRPALRASGPAEMAGLLAGLDGRFVPPGPSGAPTRGRPDVLPTGRNFYSVDTRAVPTPAAWALGWASAQRLTERHAQEQGDWPRAIALTAWGTANMRTGGDDIAQALALMGVRPRWDGASRRVTGFEILPLEVLGRPRVDVTLRISGFFRDAFPGQIDLLDSAARAVMALDEPAAENPAAARYRAERARLAAEGAADPEARAGYRVFGAKPGAYGAGLQALIDERLWESRADLAETWLDWGGHAYGQGAEGTPARDRLAARLAEAEAVVQNQDNREHDLLDSDDYYQFEGGMAATVEHLSGAAPAVYHADHSRPERPVIRTLAEEVGRVVRARVVNPKWIAGVRRHGYKGAFEMAATVDYLFAFAATTHAVADHHFELVHDAYLADDDTRAFLAEANPAALREIAARLGEAIERGLWRPRANSVRDRLAALAAPHTDTRSPSR
ncbi:cobaltochelatase subunit CobN [Paralimibaculum aggregatum]|uniref:Cobaltochelatase subunit CobN n=1 Tax=Paralimibaculum aggregatum TaxID=3036245 RepID=A0ABQ6LTY1_9RHOB|nr:cobaltochelatase subunit CobN [Limibaculum sp. NKW23]GMG85528.1 cobaltochelatase subunit CobN [Limibaculum sp. NKW23]